MLSSLKDYRRRTKQQLLQTLGIVDGGEDTEFQTLYAEYKATIAFLDSIQTKMRAHAQLLQQTHLKATELTAELVAFQKHSATLASAKELAKAHAEVAVTAAAIRMYDSEVIAPLNCLMWQAPEVDAKVRERKSLLLDYNAHLRKLQAAQAQLAKIEAQQGRVSRRKSETEVAEDVATRKARVDYAQKNLEESTHFLVTEFLALAEKREQGALIEGPMNAFAAIQRMLAADALAKMDKALPQLHDAAGKYKTMLDSYLGELRKLKPEEEAPVETSPVVFARPLSGTGRAPAVVRECVKHLEFHGTQVEGLFRVPGNAVNVQALRERYDAGESEVVQGDNDAHDVATLLKLYFRELPSPVVPDAVYVAVIEAARLHKDDDAARREAVCDAVLALPSQNLTVLGLLLNLLQRIARNSAVNKMNSTNLATCFAPTILRAPAETSPAQVLNEMQWAITAFRILVDEAKRFAGQKSRENSLAEANSILNASSSHGRTAMTASALGSSSRDF